MTSKSLATFALTAILVSSVSLVSLVSRAHAYDDGPPPDFSDDKPAAPAPAPAPSPSFVPALAPTFAAAPTASPNVAPSFNDGSASEGPRRERKVFYGWENMVVSYSGLALFYGGGFSSGPEKAILGAAIYALGSPIVHIANGDSGGKAYGALMINALTPVVFGALGHTTDRPCSPHDEECDLGHISGMIYGAMLGSLVAPLLDGFLLGWKPEKTPEFGIAPTMTLARKEDPTSATTVGVSGFF